MEKTKIVMWIVSGMMAWGAITQGAEEDVIAQNIEQLRKQGIE